MNIKFKCILLCGALLNCANAFSAASSDVVQGQNWPGGVINYYIDPTRRLTPLGASSISARELNFCKAIDYLQLNTQLKFVDKGPELNFYTVNVCNSEDGPLVCQDYWITNGDPSGYAVVSGTGGDISYGAAPSNGAIPGTSYIALTQGASARTALHEIIHLAWGGHEHQRYDRDDYIHLKVDSSHPADYTKGFYEYAGIQTGIGMWGGFDHASIMRYDDSMLRLSNQELMTLLKQSQPAGSAPFSRQLAILRKDSTDPTAAVMNATLPLLPGTALGDLYDNQTLGNQYGDALVPKDSNVPPRLQPFNIGEWSSNYDFEWVQGNNFRIKQRWNGRYLAASGSSVIFKANPLGTDATAQWELVVAVPAGSSSSYADTTKTGEFHLKNIASSRYLVGDSVTGNVTLIQTAPQFSQAWIIKARTLHDREDNATELSMLDKVALHVNYGSFFTFKAHGNSAAVLGPVYSQSSAMGTLRAASLASGSAPTLYYFDKNCFGAGVPDTQSKYLCIRERWTGWVIRAEPATSAVYSSPDSGSYSTTTYPTSQQYKDSMLWELVPIYTRDPAGRHFRLKNKLNGKYWSAPATNGNVTMVDLPGAGKWLINDELTNGNPDYKHGKQRSAACAAALGKPIDY